MVDGRCPQCGVDPTPMGEVDIPWDRETQQANLVESNAVHGHNFRHLSGCPLELGRQLSALLDEHRFPITPVLVEGKLGKVRVLRLVDEA